MSYNDSFETYIKGPRKDITSSLGTPGGRRKAPEIGIIVVENWCYLPWVYTVKDLINKLNIKIVQPSLYMVPCIIPSS